MAISYHLWRAIWTKAKSRYRIADGKKRGGLLRVPREAVMDKGLLIVLGIAALAAFSLFLKRKVIPVVRQRWDDFWRNVGRMFAGNGN